MFMLIQNIIGYFFGASKAPDVPMGPSSNLTNGNITFPRGISSTHLQNYLRPGDKFDYDVYLSFYNNNYFF